MQSCLVMKKIPRIISSRTKIIKLCIFIPVLNPFQLEGTCIIYIFTLLSLHLLRSLTDSHAYNNIPTQPSPHQARKEKNPCKKTKLKNSLKTNKTLPTTSPPCIFVLVVRVLLGRAQLIFSVSFCKSWLT